MFRISSNAKLDLHQYICKWKKKMLLPLSSNREIASFKALLQPHGIPPCRAWERKPSPHTWLGLWGEEVLHERKSEPQRGTLPGPRSQNYRVADRVSVLRLGVRSEPPRWESRVHNIGPLETSWPHMISIGESSPRDLHLNAKTQLHSTTSKLQYCTPLAKQLARQEHNPTH